MKLATAGRDRARRLDERPRPRGGDAPPFRMFATWRFDDEGPLFCRWTAPAADCPDAVGAASRSR